MGDRAIALRKQLFPEYAGMNDGELAAFIQYGHTFPHNFLALVDSYDVLKSGVPNAISVAVALLETGQGPGGMGVRLDSGDLVAQSLGAKALFASTAAAIAPELGEKLQKMVVV